MADSMTMDVNRATTWSIVLSVLLMIAGLLAIFAPMIAGLVSTVVIGWLLIFAGVLHFVYAWSGENARMVMGQILLGLLYCLIGGYVLYNPVAGLVGLAFAIAVYLFAEGILEFVLAAQLRPAPGSGWLIFDGIITVLLAILIASSWPSSAAWAVGVLVGASMFFGGMTRLMLSLAVRRRIAA
jgi:uncharacterized membrane protein HdeD (DUF308 family)